MPPASVTDTVQYQITVFKSVDDGLWHVSGNIVKGVGANSHYLGGTKISQYSNRDDAFRMAEAIARELANSSIGEG